MGCSCSKGNSTQTVRRATSTGRKQTVNVIKRSTNGSKTIRRVLERY